MTQSPANTQPSRLAPWLLAAAGVAVLLAVPHLVENGYWRRIISVSMVWVVLTLGFNFILGFAGQLSLGHVGFFGIGAYVSAIATTRMGLSFLMGLTATIAISGVLGVLLGVPLLRLRTHYLALATLGFSEVVKQVAVNWKAVTRGHDGILAIPSAHLGPWVFRSDIQQYYFLLVCTAVLAWVAYRFSHSRYGLGFRAIRDSELAAGLMGINTYRFKVLAFTLSAIYAGIAGSLYVQMYRYLSPDAFGMEVLLASLAMLLVGGAGTVAGPVVGGVFLTFLPEWLRAFKDYYMVVYGFGLVALIVFMPSGLAGTYRSVRQRWLVRSGGEGRSRGAT